MTNSNSKSVVNSVVEYIESLPEGSSTTTFKILSKLYGVVNGRFCPQSVRSFCPVVAGFNAGTYKVPACVL